MDIFMREFALAYRKLARRPGVTVLAIASLALAIGFSTAAFSVVDAYYWRGLPVAEPEQLAYMMVRDRENRFDELTWAEFEAIRQQASTLEGFVVQHRRGPRVKLPDRDDFPITAGVSDNFFDVLGVGSAKGSVFHDGGGQDGQVVISDRYWHSAFGTDPSIIGRSVTVRNASLTIVGVLPAGFSGTVRGLRVDLFVPMQAMFGSLGMASPANFRNTSYEPVLRRKRGVALETVRQDIDQVLRRREAAGMAPDPGRKAFVLSFTNPQLKPEITLGDVFPVIVLLVLVIAAANLANLRLVENAARRRDTGIRLALGAGRAVLLRQHLAESFLLAGAGAAGGLLVAVWLIDLAPALLYSGQRYRDYFVRLDARVFCFSAGALVLVALIGALVPLRDAWRTRVVPSLQAIASPRASRWLSGLVVLQMVLTTAAANSAGLLWQSLRNVAAIRPAMDPDRRMLIIEGASMVDDAWVLRSAELADELSAIPGVVRVGYARRVMLSGSGTGWRTTFEQPGQPKLTFRFNQVSPSYFAATGPRILEGRSFAGSDGPQSTPVVMVSEAFALKFFAGREAVGAWVRLEGKDRQIVGVVEDGPSAHIREDIEPFIYFPFAQWPQNEATYFLETARDPELVAAAVQERLRSQSATYQASDLRTMARHTRAQRGEEQLAASVGGGLALLGLVLAAAGLFGVTLFAVNRRTREFGVRVALGATGGMLGRQVVLRYE